jgi:hypothetical protein
MDEPKKSVGLKHGTYKIVDIKEKKEKKPKSKTTLRVKNDKSKGASFWVVDIKGGEETIIYSGTITECKDYIYLASRNLML